MNRCPFLIPVRCDAQEATALFLHGMPLFPAKAELLPQLLTR